MISRFADGNFNVSSEKVCRVNDGLSPERLIWSLQETQRYQCYAYARCDTRLMASSAVMSHTISRSSASDLLSLATCERDGKE